MISNLLVASLIHKLIVQEIPTDKTGNFDEIYEFLEDHWKIVKWVALGAVILEVTLLFMYARIRIKMIICTGSLCKLFFMRELFQL